MHEENSYSVLLAKPEKKKEKQTTFKLLEDGIKMSFQKYYLKI
jgi:hypothetical protein